MGEFRGFECDLCGKRVSGAQLPTDWLRLFLRVYCRSAANPTEDELCDARGSWCLCETCDPQAQLTGDQAAKFIADCVRRARKPLGV